MSSEAELDWSDGFVTDFSPDRSLSVKSVRNGRFVLDVDVTTETAARSDKALSIEEGAYYDCVMPEDAAALWGPIPTGSLPPGVEENQCKVVTHG